MDRGEFIKVCSGSCLGLVGLSLLIQGCAPIFATATFSENSIQVSKTEFEIQKKNKTYFRKFVLVKQSESGIPIVVYRNGDNDYKALLLRCTHQGSELSVSGNIISCPAHGSEFASDGSVIQGPAEENLKSFRVTSDANDISIYLS